MMAIGVTILVRIGVNQIIQPIFRRKKYGSPANPFDEIPVAIIHDDEGKIMVEIYDRTEEDNNPATSEQAGWFQQED